MQEQDVLLICRQLQYIVPHSFRHSVTRRSLDLSGLHNIKRFSSLGIPLQRTPNPATTECSRVPPV